jgi:RNA polymerase sigma factor (sigma-70 family)
VGSSSSSGTSPTLLGRLRHCPTDQSAWNAFVDRYGPKIYAWCQHWQLQQADAEDVTQTVLLKLAHKMATFTYDPSKSFRAWLKTVTRNAWSDFLAARNLGTLGTGDSKMLQTLASVEARDDLAARLEQEFDNELLDMAVIRVQLRVTPEKWEVFRLLALEGLSGAEVAGRVNMKVATVFVVRSKVQKLLQDEIRKLELAEASITEGSS